MDIGAVFHNIRSVHNVGSMFRTADALGVANIYLSGITPGPVDRFGRARDAFSKVSLGAENTVPFKRVGDGLSEGPDLCVALIASLKADGYVVAAIEQTEGSVSYRGAGSFTREEEKKGIVVVVGNEVEGLPSAVLSASDMVLEIPMYGTKESLNVSVAFGIVVAEIRFWIEQER